MIQTQLSDAILVERFQNGDVEAMNHLVNRYRTMAYRLAVGLAKDQDVAADIVAEAFVRMFRSGHTFKGESTFSTWVYRVVTNCFLDMRKRSRTRQAASLDQMISVKDCLSDRCVETKGAEPYEALESRERNRTIREKMEKLPEYQKAMILLYHQEMLSYEEIAETLEMPIGTVKSRLNRARLKLRH